MTRFVLAANNGEMGGGEVMLLATARILRDLGHEVTVVAPRMEGGVGAAAAAEAFPTVAIDAPDRVSYMRNLRRWDRSRRGAAVLWCHGHVPALATAGHPNRIVHLHQAPSSRHVLAGRLAGYGALVSLVPSRYMQSLFPDVQVYENFTEDLRQEVAERREQRKAPSRTTDTSQESTPEFPSQGTVTLGFLGRPSPDKGVLVLAEALRILDSREPGRYRLLLAGEPRFVDEAEQERVSDALAPITHLVDTPGWMDRRDFFASVDLAVFPSIVSESFGLMTAEAMSAQTPFIISDAGALPELAGPDYPWVAPAGNASALADMIEQACAASPADRENYVTKCRQRWEEHYSASAAPQRLAYLLTDVLPAYLRSAV